MIKFDAPKEMSSIIKVIGVGGGGSNAVNHMFSQGIKGVDFIVCNTDSQALDQSPIANKIQLGESLTEGRGAGSQPEIGKNCAIENIEDIKKALEPNTKMLFITAGMGGGTGTGAAPVIAAVAKELGILTVAIVTIPFSFEGRKRKMQADQGIEELRKHVDTLLIISNDKLRELHGNLKLMEAFNKADNILTDAARGIAELITVAGYVNVDFEDVKTVMKDSGVAIMGTGRAGGSDRALRAVEMALSSPLLNDSHIRGAKNILLYIGSGLSEIEMDEVAEITDYIQEEAGLSAEIIWGTGIHEELDEDISITVIATGFETEKGNAMMGTVKKPEKIIVSLEAEVKNEPKVEAAKPELADDGFKLITKVQEEKLSPKNPDIEQIINMAPTSDGLPLQQEKKIIHTLDEFEDAEPSVVYRNVEEVNFIEAPARQEEVEPMQKLANERIKKLRDLSAKLANSETLKEIENIPAYMRRGVVLAEVPASNENISSKYVLDNETGELRKNNSFLHDNVD